FETLRVQGLMTLALFTPDTERVRACFVLLRNLRDRVRDTDPDLIGPGELSMGMSGDYEVAIEEGSTCVRVGQAIFGARSYPDSYYWPPQRPSGEV
ncbi:MAG: YggS family pyridoxal phosphate-dependent enzyme, partial [Propionibacterium sp.]|nr:YggS family pyridoxal phosphate-dependent enzyme [Propionibacterium sp.]